MIEPMEDLVRHHLNLATSYFEAWLELLDEDMVIRFPKAGSAGLEPEVRGKAAIRAAISIFFAKISASGS